MTILLLLNTIKTWRFNIPDYTITLTDVQEVVLKEIAKKADRPVQVILNEQAFFRVKEQLDVWIEEYLKDVSNLSVIQQTELNAHLVACKQAFIKNAAKAKGTNNGVL